MTGNLVKELDFIFNPRTIAFVGASNDRTKWGGRTMQRALAAGYCGRVYPVNPKEREIQGTRAYGSVLDVPDDVDLAVITVPAPAVLGVMEESAAKGVRAAIVISAGFAETGEEGRRMQEEVARVARRGRIRMMGPNCMGIWSATAKLSLPFDPAPRSGPIAFVSQSGTFGGFLVAVAGSKGYGFSRFVSAGNQADLDAADYLEYLGEDDETKAIVFYLEGLNDGRRFFDIAREVVKYKPITLYKAGRTQAGEKASLSHTGSLSGADDVFDAMCRQVGILRGYEAVHPFDMAEALSKQPVPRSKRVAIITLGGGFCVTAADACATFGLQIPTIDRATQERIKTRLLPHAAMPCNPIDTAGDFRPEIVPWVAEQVAALDYIDGIITTTPFIIGSAPGPDGMRDLMAATETMIDIPRKFGKPMVLSMMRGFGESQVANDMLRNAGIPIYDTPEDCARAMQALMHYGEVRREALARETEELIATSEILVGSAAR